MAAGKTYVPIVTTTLVDSQTSVTFNGFGGYTDLILVVNGVASTEATDTLTFNGDSSSNYSYASFTGSPASSRQTNRTFALLGNTYTDRYIKIINILNYSNSTTHKSLISRSGYQAGTYAISAWVNVWRSTAPITSMTIGPDAGTMSSGTTLALYGILAA